MNGVNNIWTAYAYNPASQLTIRWSNTDAYAFNGYVNVNRGYAANGLNQYTSAGPATFAYDPNGNLTRDSTTSFAYDVENRLVSASGARNVNLAYDPLGRLWQVSGGPSGTTRFLYDGDALVAEYDASGNMLKRYVHGQGADTPQVWFEGAGTSAASRRYLFTNHQGSVTAIADGNGNTIAINRYDEYGIPGAGNIGRFQYTGQAWLEDLGMYHYKARIYSPTLGRFLQTDPIGYEDQINLYAYVGNDPVNSVDPSGMCGSLIAEKIAANCSGETVLQLMAIADFNEAAAAGKKGTEGSSGAGRGMGDNGPPEGPLPGDEQPASKEPIIVQGLGLLRRAPLVGLLWSSPAGEPQAAIDNLVAKGRGKQFNGRPRSPAAQNKQVADAAKEVGLNKNQQGILRREIEKESRQYGENLGYHDILSIAREIKSGRF